MKTNLLLIGGILLCSLSANAKSVNRQTALQNARNCMLGLNASLSVVDDGTSKKQAKRYASSANANNQSIYIFNISGGGFVVASGDDRLPAVLGYSTCGTYDSETAPTALSELIDSYSNQVNYIQQNKLSVDSRRKATHKVVEPMMTSLWDQDNPYNNSCPDFFTYGKSVTGCTAAAMAQVLYYHRNNMYCVTSTKAEMPAYSGNVNWSGAGTVDVSAVPAGSEIDWANMLDSYSGSFNSTQAKAVADLMFYCGASINTTYANSINGGSSASLSSVPGALKKYFGYNNKAKVVSRDNYDSEDTWDEIIYGEIASGRPVMMAGQSSDGGHGFVADGYDGNGYYHINWGWSGAGNGYFMLDDLTPSVAGIGAGASDGYNNSRQALIYAEPSNDIYTENVVATATSFTLDAEGSKSGNYYQMPFKTAVTYLATGSSDFYIALGVFDANGNLVAKTSAVSHIKSLNSGWSVTSSGTRSISLASGTYTVCPISSVDGSTNWTKCEGDLSYTMIAGSTGATYTANVVGKVNLVTITPTEATMANCDTQQFTATVSGSNLDDAQKSVKWTISGNSSTSTTISDEGLLSIGSDEKSSVITVKATSVYDALMRVSVSVNLTTTTEIRSVKGDVPTVSCGVYNTVGQKLSKTVKGQIYIQNNKKVLAQ